VQARCVFDLVKCKVVSLQLSRATGHLLCQAEAVSSSSAASVSMLALDMDYKRACMHAACQFMMNCCARIVLVSLGFTEQCDGITTTNAGALNLHKQELQKLLLMMMECQEALQQWLLAGPAVLLTHTSLLPMLHLLLHDVCLFCRTG
jgi:hypothetical protein